MDQISAAVKQLYDAYPFPPDPLSDEPPPGYNWRWNWSAAYSFCTGQKPQEQQIRILDAGCGTGSSTEYLIHLNPEAAVTGIDLSEGALKVARERCQRSGITTVGTPTPEFHHLSVYDVDRLPGQFDLINCVGVLHHLPDPVKGLRTLALKLAPGGLMHIFVYAELGRWEIQLMQQAIALLQGKQRQDYQKGIKIGRQLFATLPQDNRLVQYEAKRWALENQRDECFADMYVHPQEIDYNVNTLFELIDASGLEFMGFSNPDYWNPQRLLGQSSELMTQVEQLSDRDRYRLIELLDPEISHYEFFLGRPPLPLANWSDDAQLQAAIAEVSPCLNGWPAQTLFDYNYQLASLSEVEYQFMQACNPEKKVSVGEILTQVSIDLDGVRSLQSRQFILLTPA